MASRIAIITGGNRGLGRNIVLALARQGVSSIFTYRSHSEEADAVVKEAEAAGRDIKAHAIQLEVTDFAAYGKLVTDIQSVLASWGRDKVDIVIPSAGVGLQATLTDIKADDIDTLHAIHFKAPLLLIQRLLPIIRDGETSVIVTISSGLARFTVGNWGTYASMKGAIEVATRYLAKEVGSRGIRAICARVGVVASDFGGGAVRDVQAIQDHLKGTIALGRVATPDDIGPVIAGLTTPQMAWISGTTIEISGGQSL